MDTNRRNLIGALGGLASIGLVPSIAIARNTRPAVDAVGAFRSSFSNPVEAIGPTRVAFDGRLPAALAGTLYRNGPARLDRGSTHYRHWFDGDGMVQGYRIGQGRLEHRGRMVATTRAAADARAGRFLRPGFGTTFTDGLPLTRPDDANVANIGVLPLGGELLALWEAGSAWRLDPDTLETRGRKVFSPDTDGMSFSAHPRVAPDGRVWNFGYMPGSGKLAIYDIAPNGALRRATLIDAPNADMVHDFAIAGGFLVFVLAPFDYDREAPASTAFMHRLRWRPERGVTVLLVDQRTLAVAHRFELEAFFAFHYGNAWVDGDSIRIETARSPAFEPLMAGIERATLGQPGLPRPPAEAPGEIVLDLRRGRARMETLPLPHGEFPSFDPRHTGEPTTRLVMLSRSGRRPGTAVGFDTVMTLDRRRNRIQHFDYGDHTLAEEHLFVPAPRAAEGIGWIVGTAFDWRAQRTMLSVFDAAALDAGPLARATLPYRLPLGLHGRFVAA